MTAALGRQLKARPMTPSGLCSRHDARGTTVIRSSPRRADVTVVGARSYSCMLDLELTASGETLREPEAITARDVSNRNPRRSLPKAHRFDSALTFDQFQSRCVRTV